MSQSRDQPSSRLRSSPRERSGENVTSSAPVDTTTTTTADTVPTSSASSMLSVKSEGKKEAGASTSSAPPSSSSTSHIGMSTLVGEQGSPKKSATSGLKSISKFLRSHKRHKSLDVLPSLTSSNDPKKPQDSAREMERPKSPLKNTIVEEDEDQEYEQNSERKKSSKEGKINEDDNDDNNDNFNDDNNDDNDNDIEFEEDKDLESPKSSRELPKMSSSSGISENYIKDVLGISIKDWPYSEKLLLSTISLQAEKEKTRKESLKVTSLQNSIDLVKLSIESGIPPNLIPNLFTTNGQAKELIEKIAAKKSELEEQLPGATKSTKPLQFEFQAKGAGQSSSTAAPPVSTSTNAPPPVPSGSQSQPSSTSKNSSTTSVFKVNIPQQTQFQFHHWQKPGQSSGTAQQQSFEMSEKKRKFSAEDAQQPPAPSSKPQTPNKFSSSNTHSHHRRNQSEANVAQLRTMFESQIAQQQHQPHQQQQQPQQPQWGGAGTLGSPYYPARESRPLYYQFPPQQPQQHPVQQPPPQQGYPPQQIHVTTQMPPQHAQQYSYPVQYVQTVPPPQFVFPPRPQSIHGTPQAKETPIQQVLPPPSQYGPPGPQGQAIQYRNEPPSAGGSPVAAKKGNSSERSSGKSNVNFLISTPNNPPNR